MLQKSSPAEAAEAQACQAKRMEIVGRLTGGVVHDFNNILTVIAGTIEILAEAVADRPELAAVAKLIDEAASRGSNLTSHLLAFARGQPSQPRDVDVNALLDEAARLLRPTLGEDIEVDTILAPDVSPVFIDPHQLMTAILNLAIAARDAMSGGGKLAFETRGSVLTESRAGANSGVADESCVMISIAVAGRLPVPDGAFVDCGTVRDFIARSNGQIKFRSDAGRGALVEVHLPKSANLARSSAPASASADIEGGAEAILIVEDDVLVRKCVIAQVRSLGYRTIAAGNASEALAIIDQGEEINLLFTDVMMPGLINGRQLAIEALNRKPSLKVLYTSGYSESAMVQDGYLDAGVPLLAKPYRKIDLAKMIRTALAD
jgi:CheY-like chemotaxis protein